MLLQLCYQAPKVSCMVTVQLEGREEDGLELLISETPNDLTER
jgi:hypothetical protein